MGSVLAIEIIKGIKDSEEPLMRFRDFINVLSKTVRNHMDLKAV